MKLKISDASWKDDEEPPPDFLEYSDDEQERAAKQQRTINKMIEGISCSLLMQFDLFEPFKAALLQGVILVLCK